MLPPPPISAPRLPGMADGTAFTTGSEAVQPGRTKASLRGTGEARVERARSRGGYGGGSLESGASPRSGRKSTDGEVSLWDNTTGSDDTSETELRHRHDDPAMEDDVLGDVGARPKMRMRKSNASAGSKKTKTPPQHEPTPHERWEAVRAKVKIVGKVQADSLNSKHYGVELDMSSSFGTSRDDNAVPPVTRLLFINPDGKFRSGWDITQVLVLFYLAWVTPYRVGFDHPAYGIEFWFEFLVDIYFIVDVFLNFATGFWYDTETTTVLVSDPSEIAINYLKTWFLIDVVACAPVDLAMRAVTGDLACSFALNGCQNEQNVSVNSNALKLFKLLRVFRLLKLLRLFRVSRLLNRYQNTLIYYHSFISVGRVILLVILISHWVGCLFGMMHNWEVQQVSDKSTRWLLSVYWAVQSITSVGYGDIPAENPYTQTLALFTMLIGVVLVSWIMTNVLAAMNPDSSARRFHERLQYVLAYLKSNQLPTGVAKRVITFYRWQNMNQFDEASVLSDLPAQLRKDIFDNLYHDSLTPVAIFTGCSSQFMTEVSLRMSPISFPQFQNVYCQGELGTKMYFITKGSVALLLREIVGQASQEDFMALADSCVELGRGSFFGEAAVLGHPSRLETIVTTRSSTMMTLHLQHMTELCQLSFEFKAKLAIIAFERMRRNRVAREIVEYCAREFGLDPDEFILGTELAESDDGCQGDGGGNADNAQPVLRTSSTRYNGATRRVVFTRGWKTLVVDRVENHSAVATIPKMFTKLANVQHNVEDIFRQLTAMDGRDLSPSGGETRGHVPVEARPARETGANSLAGEKETGDVNKRLAALESKMDTIIKLMGEKGRGDL